LHLYWFHFHYRTLVKQKNEGMTRWYKRLSEIAQPDTNNSLNEITGLMKATESRRNLIRSRIGNSVSISVWIINRSKISLVIHSVGVWWRVRTVFCILFQNCVWSHKFFHSRNQLSIQTTVFYGLNTNVYPQSTSEQAPVSSSIYNHPVLENNVYNSVTFNFWNFSHHS
jgi:hypothetical protein